MKKFSISLFIIFLFSAAVFFIGWTQFKVKAENIGVVISKTSGIDDKPVENGIFSWHWQFLLPTNARLETFSIKPVNATKTITGELPSGGLYTSIYSSQDDFSYRFVFSISLTLAPQAVVELIKLNKVTDSDDLAEYMERAADSVAQLAADYYLKKASENRDFRPESVRREDLLRNIRLYEDFPELELSVFALTESKLPDYELYRSIRSRGLPVATAAAATGTASATGVTGADASTAGAAAGSGDSGLSGTTDTTDTRADSDSAEDINNKGGLL